MFLELQKTAQGPSINHYGIFSIILTPLPHIGSFLVLTVGNFDPFPAQLLMPFMDGLLHLTCNASWYEILLFIFCSIILQTGRVRQKGSSIPKCVFPIMQSFDEKNISSKSKQVDILNNQFRKRLSDTLPLGNSKSVYC